MNILHTCCCGLDIHLKRVVACLLKQGAGGATGERQIRTFHTTTADLLALSDWLKRQGCTHVAMESTGVYWKPIYNLLEGEFELVVVNPQHIKALPGRKTDVGDAEWIADLLAHGLLRPSFIPTTPQRDLRELTRYRTTLVQERARLINRLQKVLEDANIKLGAVVSDVTGVSARAMLEALLAGESDPAALAKLARGRLREKREALKAALAGVQAGRLRPSHRFLLAQHLEHMDYLEEAIAQVEAEIEARIGPFDANGELELLDTIPGVNRRIAQIIVAEVGVDMRRFPSHRHLASWVGLCPGNNESGGKRKGGQTRKGSSWLRQALMEAAHGAARSKHTYLSAQYHRLAARKGRKKALVAVAHSISVIVYHVLNHLEPYQELGGNYYDERDREMVTRRAVGRLQRLGYIVHLQPIALPQAA